MRIAVPQRTELEAQPGGARIAAILDQLLNGLMTSPVRCGTSGWYSIVGSPEGVLMGAKGDLCSRTDGGTSTCFYVKETGTAAVPTNTGWKAK